MRLFKRHVNPIFVEEEDYNWHGKRSGGMRRFLFVVGLALVAGTTIIMMNP